MTRTLWWVSPPSAGGGGKGSELAVASVLRGPSTAELEAILKLKAEEHGTRLTACSICEIRRSTGSHPSSAADPAALVALPHGWRSDRTDLRRCEVSRISPDRSSIQLSWLFCGEMPSRGQGVTRWRKQLVQAIEVRGETASLQRCRRSQVLFQAGAENLLHA